MYWSEGEGSEAFVQTTKPASVETSTSTETQNVDDNFFFILFLLFVSINDIYSNALYHLIVKNSTKRKTPFPQNILAT